MVVIGYQKALEGVVHAVRCLACLKAKGRCAVELVAVLFRTLVTILEQGREHTWQRLHKKVSSGTSVKL